MNVFTKILSICSISLLCSSILALSSFSLAGNFQDPLDKSLTIGGTANHDVELINKMQDIGITGADDGKQIRDTIAFITIKVVIPVFVFAGLIMAIIGFYKLMVSNKGEEQQTGFNYILRGTIGIIIMVSAGYIVNQLVGTEGASGIIGSLSNMGPNDVYGVKMAEQLYVQVLFPFLRIMIFIILGILFIMVIVHAFKYIFRKDDEFQKKSFTILVYNALGIIVIIAAKSMVEAVYGKYTDVIDSNAQNLGDIGTGIIETADSFTILHTAINRVLGLATFIVLALIIYQSYQLLMNPSNEELVDGLKKNIGYTFLGIIIIGAGYLLTNFFIIT